MMHDCNHLQQDQEKACTVNHQRAQVEETPSGSDFIPDRWI